MRFLAIGPDEKVVIAKVIEYAEQNRYPRYRMMASMNGKELPCGDNPKHRCFIPKGYRVAYSIEEQPKGWAKHLSISVDTPGKCPNEVAIEMIMKEFGFKIPHIKECYSAWVEDLGDNFSAVNVLELM